MKKLIALLAVVTSMAVLSPAAALADDTDSAPMPTLADVLLADSATDNEDGFDRSSWDYDIVTQAVLLFHDLVDAASNPDAELTAFLPRDSAFRRLVYDITGDWIRSEAKVFEAVASLGVDTVKDVLLYHLVPAKISYADALQAKGAQLPTLLEDATIKVKVKSFLWWKWVKLVDADRDDRNPRVSQPNIGGEASNGFAHGINRVLRPIDLP
jgi:uncharacterized surface protein with fasciclin (FAS1) repeats